MSVPSQRVLVDSLASKNACVFCLGVASGVRQVSLCVLRPGLARHCCWHRNFQLSPRVFLNSFFELCIRWISTVTFSSFGFSIAHPLFFFSLRCFWHVFPSFSPQEIRPGCRLIFRQRSPRPCVPSWRFFFQYGESCDSCPRIR